MTEKEYCGLTNEYLLQAKMPLLKKGAKEDILILAGVKDSFAASGLPISLEASNSHVISSSRRLRS